MVDIQPHIPTATHQLLAELLFHVRDRDLVVNAKGDHFETIYRIEDAIVAMEQAKWGNALLKTRVEAFQAHADAHGDEL